jgi:hypothetical protein
MLTYNSLGFKIPSEDTQAEKVKFPANALVELALERPIFLLVE